MRKTVFLCATLLILITLSLQVVFAAGDKADNELSKSFITKEGIFYELGLFADAITLIDANYVEEVTAKEMIYGALDGMISSLDSHSSFLTPKEYIDLKTDTLGEFGGLGIKVTIRDNVLTVISPLEGTPAYKAGIVSGDRILKIDNKPTKDFTLDDAVKVLRGIPGTRVKLIIIREQESRLREFTIRRAIIRIRSIKDALMINESIGYIKIADFQKRTGSDFNRALKRLIKKNMKALIIDLRNNPGGLLDASVMVSKVFLKKPEIIVSIKGRGKHQDIVFRSNSLKPYTDFPIVTLINKGSASASEIVVAALRDNKRALVVGEKSFGKGSIQTVIPMKDGSAIRLTTSYYYTPSGAIIHEKGISPDITVEAEAPEPIENGDTKKMKKISKKEALGKDNQVQEAIGLLEDKTRYTLLLEN
jgi:carboxyl-terminal processing protease